MQSLFAPDLLGILIQTVGAILVALITKGATAKTPPRPGRSSKAYLGWGIMGVSGAVTFAGIGFLYSLVSRPTVTMMSPVIGQAIEVQVIANGSGSFSTIGVFSRSNLRLYVLIHPAQPFAAGWWILSPATVYRNGRWATVAWYGAKDFPPQVGHQLEIMAVVADPIHVAGRSQIADPKDLQPIAQSEIVGVRVGTVR